MEATHLDTFSHEVGGLRSCTYSAFQPYTTSPPDSFTRSYQPSSPTSEDALSDVSTPNMFGDPSRSSASSPTQAGSTVVRLRGLPFNVSERQIRRFFDGLEMDQVHILNSSTGDAFVVFVDEANAAQALTRNDNYIGQRYVKVWLSSYDDMANAKFEKVPPKHRCKEITQGLMDAASAECFIPGKGFTSLYVIIRDMPKNLPHRVKSLVITTIIRTMWKVVSFYRSDSYASSGHGRLPRDCTSPEEEVVKIVGRKPMDVRDGPNLHCAIRVVEKALSRNIFVSDDVSRLENILKQLRVVQAELPSSGRVNISPEDEYSSGADNSREMDSPLMMVPQTYRPCVSAPPAVLQTCNRYDDRENYEQVRYTSPLIRQQDPAPISNVRPGDMPMMYSPQRQQPYVPQQQPLQYTVAPRPDEDELVSSLRSCVVDETRTYDQFSFKVDLDGLKATWSNTQDQGHNDSSLFSSSAYVPKRNPRSRNDGW